MVADKLATSMHVCMVRKHILSSMYLQDSISNPYLGRQNYKQCTLVNQQNEDQVLYSITEIILILLFEG